MCCRATPRTVPSGWSSSAPAAGSSGGTVSASIASLAANASATFTLVVQVTSGTAPGTVIGNTASVGPVYGDPDPSNNSVSFSTTVGGLTVSVVDAGGTYNGSAFPATAIAVGVDGQTQVAGSFTFAYYVGTDTSGTSLGATAPPERTA